VSEQLVFFVALSVPSISQTLARLAAHIPGVLVSRTFRSELPDEVLLESFEVLRDRVKGIDPLLCDVYDLVGSLDLRSVAEMRPNREAQRSTMVVDICLRGVFGSHEIWIHPRESFGVDLHELGNKYAVQRESVRGKRPGLPSVCCEIQN
jgi:hypothetical protein